MRKKIAILMIIVVIIVGASFMLKPKNRLRVAVFAGSNWNVPEADSYQLLDEFFTDFETKHPGVEIDYTSGVVRDSYGEWISQRILDDNLPDVLFVPSELFSILCKNQTLQPLEKYISKDTNFNLSIYYDSSLQSGYYNDKLYALPYLSVPELMFVNKSLLSASGYKIPSENWSWQDFLEIVKGVTKDINGDGKLDQYGFVGYTWEQAAYTNNVEFYDERANSVSLSSDAMIETVTFLRELYKACNQNEVTGQMFDEGLVAFKPMNYSDYRTYAPYPWRVKKFSKFDWECLPFPAAKNGDNVSAIDTLMIGMSAHSSNPDLAWELMRDLSSSQQYQKLVASQLPGVSALPSVMKSADLNQELGQYIPGTSQFEMKILDTVMNKGRSVRRTQDFEQIVQSANAIINDLCHNQQDIENELIRLDQNINSILKKR